MKTKRLLECGLVLLCALLLVFTVGKRMLYLVETGRASEAEAPLPTAEAAPLPTAEPIAEEVAEPVIPVALSEWMAANKTCLQDEDGDFSDWIELVNTGSEPVNLEGYWLSDDPGTLKQWAFPAKTLAPGEYLIVFCSGKDRAGEELHTGFSLSKNGDGLYFSSPKGVCLWSEQYTQMASDHALCYDTGEARTTLYATPGYENTESGYERFLAASDRHGALVLNEAVLYNDDYLSHAHGTYDWVELKNVSDSPILLSDYYLTDSADAPLRFRLPEVTLQPGGLYIVFCGEPATDTSYCHAPFGLDSAGDELYLYTADGALSDCMGLRELPVGCSRGRMDGEAGFFLFEKRSPDQKNSGGARFISAEPASDLAPGVYDGVESLSVALSAPGEIYYTLDGSIPTAKSMRYTEPFSLDKTVVIRAVSLEEGKYKSNVITFSYILNEGHSLPVLSVVCEPRQFNSMYNVQLKAEHDATAAFFDGENGFYADCMITLHGASSREVWNKKNFKLVFKDRYGGALNYDLFGNGITSFHSFLLRGGKASGMLCYRDPLTATVANQVSVVDPLALASRYCILYINGAYWGIYDMREAYSSQYVADHLGADEDSVRILRAPVWEDKDAEFYRLYSYICGNMADESRYAYASERVDMQNFAQWMLFQCYFNNLDPTGNIRYLQADQPDGKWRLMLFDFDIALASRIATFAPILDKEAQIGGMTSSLRRSDAFCTLLLETAAALYENGLNYQLLRDTMDGMVQQLEPEMARNLKRWGETEADYANTLKSQYSFFSEERDQTWVASIQSYTRASNDTMKQYFPDFYE